jgi:hypothetical protein
MSDCRLYAPNGELSAEVKPEGDTPTLESGDNRVSFGSAISPEVTPRARVTVITRGNLIGE